MNDDSLLFYLKTLSGEDILGTFVDESTESRVNLIYIHLPVKLEKRFIFTQQGIQTSVIPSLYAEHGISQFFALNAKNFQLISQASDFNKRYYQSVVAELISMETSRIVSVSAEFDSQEYYGQYMYESPRMIQ